MAESEYTREFFEKRPEKRRSSAAAIVPLVMELVAPRSVVDLGLRRGRVAGDVCGARCRRLPRRRRRVGATRLARDPARATADLGRPFTLDRQFDLAVSLEVGEHLPESAAKRFVETLVALAPCVLFSAAIPRQGGRHHVNEQWPQYWAALFADHGYQVIDAIRPRVWSAPGVSWSYKQNTLIYAREEVIAARPLLARGRAATVEEMLAVVHPRRVDYVAADPAAHVRRPTASEYSLREPSYAFPRAAARSARWRLGRLRNRARRGSSG